MTGGRYVEDEGFVLTQQLLHCLEVGNDSSALTGVTLRAVEQAGAQPLLLAGEIVADREDTLAVARDGLLVARLRGCEASPQCRDFRNLPGRLLLACREQGLSEPLAIV